MARAFPASTWERGFKSPLGTDARPWKTPGSEEADEDDTDAYVCPPSKTLVTSTVHNDVGVSVIRTWPTLYDGTNSPHGVPSWWKHPGSQVDVLICGAGPSGLEVAVSLARQGVSFRIIDKSSQPLIAGRADGVQPRFLETLATWGLANEVSEEGPLIERTAIYKDGQRLLFDRSHQSDSRYRGLHIITQGQIERILIRDLARHAAVVEREHVIDDFHVAPPDDDDDDDDDDDGRHDVYPVCASLRNLQTGATETLRAKFLVGCDGAASGIRKKSGIPFDGVSTGIYWGIMDCIYESDYPHAWVFGSVISSKHGGCVIIPREEGYIRLYTQLDVSATGSIAQSRQAAGFAESGGQVDVHSITPDEVLAQANRIFAPYTLKFAAPLSWFAVWKISERVARSFSTKDQRVHLVGDAAHVHSVMGAFGLNASIIDAANLGWKLGLVANNRAQLDRLLPSYSSERRAHAVRIIEASGRYLRFVCGSSLPVADLNDPAWLGDSERVLLSKATAPVQVNGTGQNGVAETHGEEEEKPTSSRREDLEFLASFFQANGQFLLGVDCPYDDGADQEPLGPIKVRNAVRAPNPRVCFDASHAGYLYDKLGGGDRFHIVLFLSTLTGREVRRQARAFVSGFLAPAPDGAAGFYERFGGASRFGLVVVVKATMPGTLEEADGELEPLLSRATILYDDRAPDEDAHYMYGVDQRTGGVVVVRPDLWVGVTAYPEDTARVVGYFEGFMLPERSV